MRREHTPPGSGSACWAWFMGATATRPPRSRHARVSVGLLLGGLLILLAASPALGAGNITPPVISGSTDKGSTLTVSDGTWSFEPASFYYRWYRDGGLSRSGADATTLDLSSGSAGQKITAAVTAYDDEGNAFEATSAPVAIPAIPRIGAGPLLSPRVLAGGRLTILAGELWMPPDSTFAYRWVRQPGVVDVGSAAEYQITPQDLDHTIWSNIVVANHGYGYQQQTGEDGFRANWIRQPWIQGSSTLGSTLSLWNGQWDAALGSEPLPEDIGYQWYRDGEPIDGETGPTYTVGEQDASTVISARVTGGSNIDHPDGWESDGLPIDWTPPTITLQSPTVNDQGWTRGEEIKFRCEDEHLVASCSAPYPLDEGPVTDFNALARDVAGNESSATFTFGVDRTPPTITGSVDTVPGPSGWYTEPVVISFTCADALSGIASCSDPMVADSSAADQQFSGEAIDLAENYAISEDVLVSVDLDLPGIEATTTDNGDGTVTVSFTCSDGTSGIELCPEPVTVTHDGPNQSVTGTARDVAGNEATATVSLSVDDIAPEISATLAPAPNADGWNASAVQVIFTCSDAGGIASCPEPVTVDADGAAQTVSGTAQDNAGNEASVSIDVSIDRAAPTISASAAGAPNAAGWYHAPVTVSFACADPLSGIASCAEPQTVSTDGDAITATGVANDRAGNSASAETTVRIDATAPSVDCQPASFTVGQSGTVSAAVSDVTSGALHASVTAPAATTAAGSFTVTLTGEDIAGNATTVACSYTVTAATPTITVHVTDSTGAPYVGVRVQHAGSTGGYDAGTLTDANGDVVYPVVSGQHSFTAWVRNGYQTKTVNVTGATTVSFQTRPVTVRVLDSSGAGYTPATAQVSHAGNTGAFFPKAPVAASGELVVEALTGVSSLTAWVRNGYQTKTLTVSASGPNEVVFQTRPVTVRVLDSTGAGYTPTTASISHAGNTGAFFPKAPVATGGELVLEALPGNSTFTAWARNGYQTKSLAVSATAANEVNFQTIPVTVHVTKAGAALATAQVSHAGNTGTYFAKAPVNANGDVIFEALPGASYFTAWDGASYRNASTTVTGPATVNIGF